MQKLLTKHHILPDERGVVAVLVALCLIVFVGISAFALDFGHKYVVRNELQNAADAAALAGAQELGQIYKEHGSISNSRIVAACQQVAIQNASDTAGIIVNDSDVQIGRWDYTYPLPSTLPAHERPNAVRVRVQRAAGASNSSIPTWLGGIIGTDTMQEGVIATAALFGIKQSGAPLPLGISEKWYDGSSPCGEVIPLYPTQESCAGWHVYTTSPAADVKLRTLILEPMLADLNANTYEIPTAIAGQTRYNFIGGTLSENTFEAFDAVFQVAKLINDLYNADGTVNENPIDGDTDDATWTSSIPVYSEPDDGPCKNPTPDPQTGGTLIIGFTKVILRIVGEAPNKFMTATVFCDNLEVPGSTADYGVLGTIPRLVQ